MVPSFSPSSVTIFPMAVDRFGGTHYPCTVQFLSEGDAGRPRRAGGLSLIHRECVLLHFSEDKGPDRGGATGEEKIPWLLLERGKSHVPHFPTR